MVEFINALNGLTWSGVAGLACLCSVVIVWVYCIFK